MDAAVDIGNRPSVDAPSPSGWELGDLWRVAMLGVIQAVFVALLWPPFLTNWDSYLYTYAAFGFEPIPLALGRWLYPAMLGSVWAVFHRLFSIDPDDAWMVFSGVSAAAAMVNVVLFYGLSRRWIGPRGALLASAIVVSSPLVGIYGSAVMTETFAMTLLLVSLLFVQGHPSLLRTAVAGLMFGAACAIREPMIFLVPLHLGLIWRYGRDHSRRFACLGLFASLAVLAVGLNTLAGYLSDPQWVVRYHEWSAGMLAERSDTGLVLPRLFLANLVCYAGYLLTFSPVLPFLMPVLLLRRRCVSPIWFRPLLLAFGLYSLAQIVNHTLPVNPRFVIPAGVLATIPIVWSLGRRWPVLLRWKATAAVIVAVNLLLLAADWDWVEEFHFYPARASLATFETLHLASEHAVLFPGALTPVVHYYKETRDLPWRIVHSGWSFDPQSAREALNFAEKEGCPVLLVDPWFWRDVSFGPGEHETYQRINYGERSPSPVANFSLLSPRGDPPVTTTRTAPPPAAVRPGSIEDD